jgi:predicted SprT family Zn-dependent metalloprotease
MEINKTTEKFKPTVSWMSQKYNELNDWLFGGFLGPCQFEVFTAGKGSQGRTLGHFYMNGRGLKYEKYVRKMYYQDWDGSKIYITPQTFYVYCKPVIGLNGNYSATEQALLNTLLHEMCHYYVYYKGIYPTQAHGAEFKNIAYRVSNASNGVFDIQRLATAEEMDNRELDEKFVELKKRKMENKKKKVNAIFVFKTTGVQLTITSSDTLVNEIIRRRQNDDKCKKILISNDINLLTKLFENGYNTNLRTYKYWALSEKDEIIKSLVNNEYGATEIECQGTIHETFDINDNDLKYIIEGVINKLFKKKDSDDIIHIKPGQILS